MRKQTLLLAGTLALVSRLVVAGEVSFARDIAPVLEQYCASCHLTGEEPGGMALHAQASYGALVNVSAAGAKMLRVKPGAPDESYLIRKLEGTQSEGMRMPLGGAPLDEKFIRRLRAWIADGAPDL